MPSHFLVQLNSVNAKPGLELTLSAERSNYLCRVLRLTHHDTLKCFDGHGLGFDAKLLDANPKAATISIVSLGSQQKKATHDLHLGLSLVKGPGQDRAIAQATQLGATHLWLFASQRSNVRLSPDRLSNKHLHWQKVATTACEQSGRHYLPSIQQIALEQLVQQPPGTAQMVFQPNAKPLPRTLTGQDRLLLVGPEGGWSAAELHQFDSCGFDQFSLGPHVLKAETVPSVALALIQAAQGWV